MPARRRHRTKADSQSTAEEAAVVRQVCDVDAVRALVEDIFSPTRYLPLVVVTTPSDTRQPRVDIADLSLAAGPETDIAVVLDAAVSWELTSRLPDQLRTFGGAIRLWWPDASTEDPAHRHPLFLTYEESEGPQTIRAIQRTLEHRGEPYQPVDRPPEPSRPPLSFPPPRPVVVPRPGPVPPGKTPTSSPGPVPVPAPPTPESPEPAAKVELGDAAERGRVRDLADQVEAAERERDGAAVRLADAQARATDEVAALRDRILDLEQQVEDARRDRDEAGTRLMTVRLQADAEAARANEENAVLRRQVSILTDRVVSLQQAESTVDDDQRRSLDQLEARAARLTADNGALRRQVRALEDQVAELQRRLYQRHVFTDPEQQVRHEIVTAWLLGADEADRDRYPLRDYTLGPDFLTSLEELEGIARDRVVDGCVDVLTRRAWQMNSRSVRQYRSSATANSAPRTREDGGTAWRANLQQGTPSARRLTWWELPDGTVELARVTLHDDHRPLR